MILPDYMIAELCEAGMVHPFIRSNVQPASLDVTLSNKFRVFVPHGEGTIDLKAPADITREVVSDRFVLHPGEFVLGSTVERVSLPAGIVGRIEGKSSLGRLGLIVHATAGYIDPGFTGTVTLEMTNMLRLPIELRADFLIAQLSFAEMAAPAKNPYRGRYQGDDGPSASRYGE